ncbi:hypothetical protein OHA27_36370 [Streptomyces sp. NBC_01619]|uniref:hypothetical protein n=1 Tax=Streptomyces sp. NBC_01619 TaxID=2975901 RepID=UPI00225BC885|nr:hypothetical protein [Streptomyces sp. NBC_01619]MCX4515673.1 hypothetical protein [Streptomyces sp. NBC_01619]
MAVTTANMGHHETATSLRTRLRELHQDIYLARTDGRHTGPLINQAREKLALTAEVVKRTDDTKGFVVPPRREVAERTLSRLTHPRHVRRYYETPPTTRQAMIPSSMITRTGHPLTTWCD